MFERYDEASRRAIYHARQEASQYGSGKVETFHLLLGVLRVDSRLALRVLGGQPLETLELEFSTFATDREIPASSVIPLSDAAGRVLVMATREAKISSHATVQPKHLLTALAQVEGPAQDALQSRGWSVDDCRDL